MRTAKFTIRWKGIPSHTVFGVSRSVELEPGTVWDCGANVLLPYGYHPVLPEKGLLVIMGYAYPHNQIEGFLEGTLDATLTPVTERFRQWLNCHP